MSRKKIVSTRRNFIKNTLKGTAGAAMLANIPSIVPASVLGKYAPSNRINVGAIGNGRIAREWDMPGVIKQDTAKILAVCDLDSNRVQSAKKWVDDYYIKKGQSGYNSTKAYEHYEELLDNKDIDAVIVATPDHWHVLPAIRAVQAGKHVYMEKPASLCISEGRILSDEVLKSGCVLQIGSQQRSMPQFKKACELVRNGRIGKLHTIYEACLLINPKKALLKKKCRYHPI